MNGSGSTRIASNCQTSTIHRTDSCLPVLQSRATTLMQSSRSSKYANGLSLLGLPWNASRTKSPIYYLGGRWWLSFLHPLLLLYMSLLQLLRLLVVALLDLLFPRLIGILPLDPLVAEIRICADDGNDISRGSANTTLRRNRIVGMVTPLGQSSSTYLAFPRWRRLCGRIGLWF
jgi:hypothetical protein